MRLRSEEKRYELLCERYRKMLEGLNAETESGFCSIGHVKWMLSRIPEFRDGEKQARWIGFVQGVLTCLGVVDLEEEIEFCRKLFKGDLRKSKGA